MTNAVAILEKIPKEMPAIGQEIHDANTMLNGNMATIVDGINKGADLYNNDLPVLANKLNLAADFIQNDWPTLKNRNHRNDVDSKMKNASSGNSCKCRC